MRPVTAFVLGVSLMLWVIMGAELMMPSKSQPASSAKLPPDANACLKNGNKLVIDFKSNLVTCEAPN